MKPQSAATAFPVLRLQASNRTDYDPILSPIREWRVGDMQDGKRLRRPRLDGDVLWLDFSPVALDGTSAARAGIAASASALHMNSPRVI